MKLVGVPETLDEYFHWGLYSMYVVLPGIGSLPCIRVYIIEGSLEVKLPTIWTDEKQSRAEAERRERSEERRVAEKE